MIIDINPLLKGEKNEIVADYYLKIDESVDDVDFQDNIHVQGTVKDMAGYIALSLGADVVYHTKCARCLKDIERTIRVDFSKTVVTDGAELQNEDDYIISENGFVDADQPLTEQIILELPLRHLCKNDCKGLCPKCGADLNERNCGCDLSEPDPRFDVLRKLLDKNSK